MNKAQASPKAITAPTKEEIRTRKTRPLTTPLRDSTGDTSRRMEKPPLVVQGALAVLNAAPPPRLPNVTAFCRGLFEPPPPL